MRPASAQLSVDGTPVAPLRRADTYLTRACGLLGTRSIDGALLISPGNSVHGMGMLYSLDVALLDRELRVLHILTLRPFGLTRPRRGVEQVLEAERGAFARWHLHPGSQLAVTMK